jgi:hypothetical protein
MRSEFSARLFYQRSFAVVYWKLKDDFIRACGESSGHPSRRRIARKDSPQKRSSDGLGTGLAVCAGVGILGWAALFTQSACGSNGLGMQTQRACLLVAGAANRHIE